MRESAVLLLVETPAPNADYGTKPPIKAPNIERRPREHLSRDEVMVLVKAARAALKEDPGALDKTGGSWSPRWPGTPGGALASSGINKSPQAALRPLGSARRIVSQKPLWLLLFYFMWQAALIGTAASLWWWRMAEKQ